MKQCTGCGEIKDETYFAYKVKATEKRKAQCKLCDKLRDAEIWRSGNKKETTAATRAANKKKNQDWLWELFSDSLCVDCGTLDPRVLKFDHLGNKKYNVADMIRSSSLEKIKAEVAKCEIVCANCHRIRTSERAGTWRALRMAV